MQKYDATEECQVSRGIQNLVILEQPDQQKP